MQASRVRVPAHIPSLGIAGAFCVSGHCLGLPRGQRAALAVKRHPSHSWRNTMKTYSEQIADLQATRAARTDRMKEIQAKAAEQERTLDTGEQEEFDTLKSEIVQIDKNIENLRDLEALEVEDLKTAKTVDDTENRKAAVST